MLNTDQANAKSVSINNSVDPNNWHELLKPGDIVIIKNGVYVNYNIKFEGEGTSTQKISVRAETPGKVFFKGTSGIKISGSFLDISGIVFDNAQKKKGFIVFFKNAKNCQLSDSAFINCGNPESTFYHIISLRHGSQNNVIRRCYMEGNISMGIGIRVEDSQNRNNIIEYVHFKNIIQRYVNGQGNGQEAIQIGQSIRSRKYSVFTKVQNCLFENASGDAEIISSKSSSNLFFNNTFRNCKGGLVLRGGNGSTVENNYFFNTTMGVRVHGKKHIIKNNYFKNVKCAILLSNGSDPGTPANYEAVGFCNISNNTIVDSTKYGIIVGSIHHRKNLNQAPHNNIIVDNIITSDSGMLIAGQGGIECKWQNNKLWPYGSAEVGIKNMIPQAIGPLDEIKIVPFSIKPLFRNNVGPLWMKNREYQKND